MGNALEQYIRSKIPYFEVVGEKKRRFASQGFSSAKSANNGDPFVVYGVQIAGIQSIYGVKWKVDVYCWHPEKHKQGFVMEIKNQDTPGSADDKLPFVMFSLAKLREEGFTTAALLEGHGIRPVVKEWCAREGVKHGVECYDAAGFAAWARRNL